MAFFEDKEWNTAANANEKPEYYQCKMLNGGTCIKCYKPSLAEVVMKRGMYKDMKLISVVKPVEKRERPRRRRRMNISETKPYYQSYNRYDLSLEGLYDYTGR